MDGKPEDPIEVGSRNIVNVEAAELALVDVLRMAIHDNVDKILDRVDSAVNIDTIRIHVERVECEPEDDDVPYYRVEARGMTRFKHLKQSRGYAIEWQNAPIEERFGIQEKPDGE